MLRRVGDDLLSELCHAFSEKNVLPELDFFLHFIDSYCLKSFKFVTRRRIFFKCSLNISYKMFAVIIGKGVKVAVN